MGSLLWRYQTGSSVYASPALAQDGSIVMGSGDSYIYCLTSTGSLQWRYQTGNEVQSSVAIAQDGSIVVGSNDYYIYCLTSTGSLLWRYQTGDWVQSSPAIAQDGSIVVGSNDNYVYCLSSTGSLQWRYLTGSMVYSSPAIAQDGSIVVGSLDTYIYCLSSAGSLQWRFQTGGGFSSPAITQDGSIVVGSMDNYIYVLGPNSTASGLFPTPSPMALPTALPTALTTASPTAPTAAPTAAPTPVPTTSMPSAVPTLKPTGQPTMQPTGQPTRRPSSQPTSRPTAPTGQPSSAPSFQPSSRPSGQPTRQPTFSLQTQIKCNVSTTLVGATAAGFGGSAAAKAAFASALAASIGSSSSHKVKLQASDVTVLSVTDVTNAVRQLEVTEECTLHALESSVCAAADTMGREETRRKLSELRLTGQGVSVSFQISVMTQQAGSSNPATAFASISGALTTAVTGGSFGTSLSAASTGIAALSGVTASATTPLVGTPLYVVTHSAKPTGTPTGAPTRKQCPAGTRHNANDPFCTTCSAGTYAPFDSQACFDCQAGKAASVDGSSACTECAIGFIAPLSKEKQCAQCQWPAHTAFTGSTACSSVCICTTSTWVIIFYLSAFFFYLGSLALVGVKSPSLLVFSVLPALDIVSDLQYILLTTFYTPAFFIACVIFVVLPSSFFVRRLFAMDAWMPHFFVPLPEFMTDGTLLWLGFRHGHPLYRGEKMKSLSFDRHDTLYKLFSYWLLWVGCIAAQAACLVIYLGLYLPLIAIHAPMWGMWLFLGFYLYQVKMLSVGQVWTHWFRVWRCKDEGRLDSRALVDTEVMNEALFSAFVFETIPHLVLQAANNQYLGAWSGVAYFSTTLSVFNCLNGLYRFVYYTRFLGVKFEDIPLEISIGTLTLKLDRATHLQGLEFQKDYSKLSASEVEMLYLDKDTRFQEIFSLLTDAETVRSKDIYNNGRYFLLPLPDSAPRKSSLISMLGMVVHVGRKDNIKANERDTWLELLGDVIMEWECNQTPVMADVRAWMIMKALKANNITSEGEMHDTLRAHRSEEERVAFIRDQLGLSGLLMQNMVLSYFSRVWAHFEASGKGAHFTFPLSE